MPGPMPTLTNYFPPLEPYLNVVHVDDDILVLDKPSGLLSVPGKDPSLWDCLEYRARKSYPTAGMCHRLDKDTSGILVMALNKRAHGKIGSQFEHRQSTKSYVARVWGEMEAENGLVDLPLATDWENKPRQRVDPENGRSSQTEWQVMEREPGITRVRLTPLTGRTHQLRVHMKAIGHVILGDVFYADAEPLAAADRLQLHAEKLGFTHPTTGEFVTFIAPCPF
ncbi:RluA family pseudouridine synthase [Devosia sp.]|uniref:RluA family pseudouridine synthase n=1 Tax=Devosia sp. TaxID=1871048 RepID=UPI0032663B7E